MSNTVTLKHVLHTVPMRHEYFYDGMAVARDGLLTLPVEQVNQLRAALFRGYRDTPDGRRLESFQELDLYIAEQTAKSAEEGISESDDSRGQPDDNDRIRTSQRKSSKQTPIFRTRDSVSGRSTERDAQG